MLESLPLKAVPEKFVPVMGWILETTRLPLPNVILEEKYFIASTYCNGIQICESPLLFDLYKKSQGIHLPQCCQPKVLPHHREVYQKNIF